MVEISAVALKRIDTAIARVERRRTRRKGGHFGVRQDLAAALGVERSQLARIFQKRRLPTRWATGRAFMEEALSALNALD